MHCIRNAAVTMFAIAAVGVSAQGIQHKAEPYEPPASAFPLASPGTQSGVTEIALAPPPVTFEVTRSDRSVRETLARWSKAAGWLHEPVHWALDKDFPIEGVAGPDVFGYDFKTAVRRLVSSTELTDRAAQPCFYLNQVVRVIPKAGLCDKNVE